MQNLPTTEEQAQFVTKSGIVISGNTAATPSGNIFDISVSKSGTVRLVERNTGALCVSKTNSITTALYAVAYANRYNTAF